MNQVLQNSKFKKKNHNNSGRVLKWWDMILIAEGATKNEKMLNTVWFQSTSGVGKLSNK